MRLHEAFLSSFLSSDPRLQAEPSRKFPAWHFPTAPAIVIAKVTSGALAVIQAR